MRPATLIIGVGNPDCGDDAAGILVARCLAERGVNAIAHTGSMLDLIEIWKEAEQVILIDAVLSGSPPGTVHIWDAHVEKLRNTIFHSSTHVFGLADVIELGRALDRLPKTLSIYGIEADQFGAGRQPSNEVSRSVACTARIIASRLDAPGAAKREMTAVGVLLLYSGCRP